MEYEIVMGQRWTGNLMVLNCQDLADAARYSDLRTVTVHWKEIIIPAERSYPVASGQLRIGYHAPPPDFDVDAPEAPDQSADQVEQDVPGPPLYIFPNPIIGHLTVRF